MNFVFVCSLSTFSQKCREIGPVTMKCENDVGEELHRQFVDALKTCSEAVSFVVLFM